MPDVFFFFNSECWHKNSNLESIFTIGIKQCNSIVSSGVVPAYACSEYGSLLFRSQVFLLLVPQEVVLLIQ